MASEGFEPPKSMTADLQSDPFGRLGNSPVSPNGQRNNDSTNILGTEISLFPHMRCLLPSIHDFWALSEFLVVSVEERVEFIHNGEVITLSEAQVWTLIGVFSAAIFGMLTVGFAALRAEMRALRNELTAKMDAGFDTVNKRIDYLDRDVQYLMRREFGDSPNQ